MCTLILLYKLLQDYPIITVHNRDIDKGRPEKPPQYIPPNTYSPIDVPTTGTWVGSNTNGLYLGITNQETQKIDQPGRSRGLLAHDILRECTTAEEAKEHLLNPRIRNQYRPANFCIADKTNAYHVIWDKETHVNKLNKGVHAIATLSTYPRIHLDEQGKQDAESAAARVDRAQELLKDFTPNDIDEAISKLKFVASDHVNGKDGYSICRHSDKFDLTSSTIYAIHKDVSKTKILYCKGNPCENKYTDYSNIVT